MLLSNLNFEPEVRRLGAGRFERNREEPGRNTSKTVKREVGRNWRLGQQDFKGRCRGSNRSDEAVIGAWLGGPHRTWAFLGCACVGAHGAMSLRSSVALVSIVRSVHHATRARAPFAIVGERSGKQRQRCCQHCEYHEDGLSTPHGAKSITVEPSRDRQSTGSGRMAAHPVYKVCVGKNFAVGSGSNAAVQADISRRV